MIVTRDIGPFIIHEDESIESALRRISDNRRRCIFVVTAEGRLVGALTDGDFRRWLIATRDPSLSMPCSLVANRRCTTIAEYEIGDRDPEFGPGIELVPVVDASLHVVGVARTRTRDFKIGDCEISDRSPVFLIAEIGVNHNGSLETARRLVDAAAAAGADCAKFQLRDLKALYREGFADGEDLGAQYTLDLLQETSLSAEDTLAALDYAESLGLVAICTPWDRESAQVLMEHGVPAFKVASADLTNHPLVDFLASSEKPLIVSTGMSTEQEIRETATLLRSATGGFALLHCNSSYPAPFKDLNLSYMSKLSEIADCHVGYSGHERGIHIPVAAVALGARIIEKHITLDKAGRGNDHRVSLEPLEFGLMVAQIRDVEAAIGVGDARKVTQGEALNRLSLSKSLVAARDLPIGQVVTAADVEVRSPGRGLQPNMYGRLLGVRISRHLAKGDFFFETDIDGRSSNARTYQFDRPWGLPVRFHDWRELASQSNPDFLEFHLSYRDLGVDLDRTMDRHMPYGLVVHSPDLFADDLILDLASSEQSVRSRSILELQRVIDMTRKLAPRFEIDRPPLIVVSLGGSTLESPVDSHAKPLMYARVIEAVNQLDLADVELIAQTLPPFPWYLGGQRHCNLFVDPSETAEFSRESGLRLCFDVAHTKLATNHARSSFGSATEILLPHTAHLHLVDAAGLDDEGLQILDGEIDWSVLVRQLDALAPSASFIPEIWQGHVDSGRGFWTALERLETLFNVRS